MSFDPAKPADDSPLDSAAMRGQLTALDDDIQTRSTVTLMNGTVQSAISGTSSNNVGTLGQSADSLYGQMQMQAVMDKLNELINALRRQGATAGRSGAGRIWLNNAPSRCLLRAWPP